MRKTNGGIIHVATVIEDDLKDRDIGLSKPQRIGLADLAASVLACRSVSINTIVLGKNRVHIHNPSNNHYIEIDCKLYILYKFCFHQYSLNA
ncbi:MAG: hypothetical protein K1060chlam4_00017 [Candidatus Anoxychlamydiales bacterium]|nr:hypothetical protein [Candidatus Anoxychlamydiales bacterium]NGX52971.1 hypothetical protein [Candidatus Anoxychlamydiales bacterium]